MTYSINLSSGNKLIDVPDGAIDSTTTSLSLVGRNVAGYGEYQNENFIHLLENFANPTQPDSPLVGQLWFDSQTRQLKVFVQEQIWQSLGKLESSTVAPSLVSARKGDFWYNTTTNQLHVFNGTAFELLTVSVPGFGKTKIEGGTVSGTSPGSSTVESFPVLNLFVDNTVIAHIVSEPIVPSTPIASLHQNSEYPGRLMPGVNFVGTAVLNGKVDQSRTLIDSTDGPLTTSSFVRTDSANIQEVESTVWSKDSLRAGILDGDDTQHLIKVGNYTGSNADPLLDGQITYTGTRLVVTCAEPFQPIRDVMSFDSGLTNKTVLTPLSTVDIGSAVKPFGTVFANSLNGSLTGSVTGNVIGNINGAEAKLDKIFTRDGLTTVADLTKTTPEFYGKFIGNLQGNIVGDTTGDVTGDVTGNLTGNVTGNVTGNLTGNVTGDVLGNVVGTLKGNVLKPNGQVMINNVNSEFIGFLTGNASTASSLAVARTINGVSFDGSQSITITDDTKLPITGGTLAGPLTLAADPIANRHAVTKQYVDQLVASKPLFFSLDTRGLSITGTGPGSVVDLLNSLAPVGNLIPYTTCRVASTVQNVSTSTTVTTQSWISITYVRSVSVSTTVSDPTRNNNLLYRVNAGGTSWEYVSG